MNPPLRTAADVRACIEGVKDGTIDILATDHAPHLAEEKELEFPYAPFGIIGLECALPLYVKALVEPGHIDWMKLIEHDDAPSRPQIVEAANKGTLRGGRRRGRDDHRSRRRSGRSTSSSSPARAATARSTAGE